MTLEEAREQLLNHIELQLCRIYEAGSEAPIKLQEFYNEIAALPITHALFEWYRSHIDEIKIECIEDEVRIFRVEDDIELFNGTFKNDDIDDLINEGLESIN